MNYSVLAYYVIRKVEDPAFEVKVHKKLLKSLNSRGRIYISNEGINAQLSLATSDLDVYLGFLKDHKVFYDADVKVHESPEHAFAKMKVKEKSKLVVWNIYQPCNKCPKESQYYDSYQINFSKSPETF